MGQSLKTTRPTLQSSDKRQTYGISKSGFCSVIYSIGCASGILGSKGYLCRTSDGFITCGSTDLWLVQGNRIACAWITYYIFVNDSNTIFAFNISGNGTIRNLEGLSGYFVYIGTVC